MRPANTMGPMARLLSRGLLHDVTRAGFTNPSPTSTDGKTSEDSMSLAAAVAAADRLLEAHVKASSASTGRVPSFYAGFDPTAASLHFGHLFVVSAMRCVATSGLLKPIALVGGATGAIGDPTGRAVERQALALSTARDNTRAIAAQLHRLLVENNIENNIHGSDPAATNHHTADPSNAQASHQNPTRPTNAMSSLCSVEVVDNHDWLGKVSVASFLAEVGSEFRVRAMLSRDAVGDRFKAEDNGLTLAELTYQAFQAYDFYHLARTRSCVLQLGGSDQYGNIVSGVTLCKRKINGNITNSNITNSSQQNNKNNDDGCVYQPQRDVLGATVPLAVDERGMKLGKSTGNATVWLDPSRTSPFALFQYLLTMEDSNLPTLLLRLTDLPNDLVSAVCHGIQQQSSSTTSSSITTSSTSLTTSFTSTSFDDCMDKEGAFKRMNQSGLGRFGQGVLAGHVTAWVHGEAAAVSAARTTDALYGSQWSSLIKPGWIQSLYQRYHATNTNPSSIQSSTQSSIQSSIQSQSSSSSSSSNQSQSQSSSNQSQSSSNQSTTMLSRDDLAGIQGVPEALVEATGIISVVDALVQAKVCASKSEARRAIKAGGVLLNGAKVATEDKMIENNDWLHGSTALLRVGKRTPAIVRRKQQQQQ